MSKTVEHHSSLSLFSAFKDEWRLPRQVLELFINLPKLMHRKIGNDRPVMILPGYMTSDRSTFLLRTFLSWHGFDVRPWGLGYNRGKTMELVKSVAIKCHSIKKNKKLPITLIGWSWGGYIAREVARDFPHLIKGVITLGSPIIGGAEFTAWAGFNKRRGVDLKTISQAIENRRTKPIRTPIVSIYSKSDKVVWWQACIDDDVRHNVTHHEVDGSHAGLGLNKDVYRLILESMNTN